MTLPPVRYRRWSSWFLFNGFSVFFSRRAKLKCNIFVAHTCYTAITTMEALTAWVRTLPIGHKTANYNSVFQLSQIKVCSCRSRRGRGEMKIYALLSFTQLLPHMRNIVIWNIPLTAGSQSFCGALNIFMIWPHDANLCLPDSSSPLCLVLSSGEADLHGQFHPKRNRRGDRSDTTVASCWEKRRGKAGGKGSK